MTVKLFKSHTASQMTVAKINETKWR